MNSKMTEVESKIDEAREVFLVVGVGQSAADGVIGANRDER